MATSTLSDYAAISPLCLRIAETMHDSRIVVSDGADQAERRRKAIPMNAIRINIGGPGFDLAQISYANRLSEIGEVSIEIASPNLYLD
jgi:hypothetical protein